MILVVGATGQVGGDIVRRLLKSGESVRILVRPGSEYGELVSAGAAAVTGDLKHRPSLAAACAGVDAVVTTANSAQRGGADNPQTVDLQGNRNLIDAARAAGVRRFVFVSAFGAAADSPSAFMRAKAQTEARLRLEQEEMAHTILAPTAFVEVWAPMVVGGPALAGRPVTLVGEGRRRQSWISAGDVAAAAVAALSHLSARNRYLPVGGPEALTWRDVVAAYERVLGREIPVQTVLPGEAVPGLPPPIAGLLAGMDASDAVVDPAWALELGVALTPLETVVRRLVGTAPAAP